ncbi:MAG: HAD family phosphatase [Euryarchaeota archaeon]|nr:HAD family phosphatase [Euryarchaeota archaeon]
MIHLRGTRGPLGIAAVVTDLDRTLTDRRLRVHAATLFTLRKLRRRGVRLVLATGRSLREFRSRRALLHTFDAFILEGGGLVGPRAALRPTKRRTGTFEAFKSWLREQNLQHRSGETCISVARSQGHRLQKFPHLEGLQVTPNHDRIDITLRGVHKGSGLRALRAGIVGRGNVLAFGDGENDVALFKAADYRVAVANAVPSLQAEADETTDEYGGSGVRAFLENRLLGGSS